MMMKKVAVVTDSNSGITQKLAEQLGVYVLPMPFKIGTEDYFEDINITQEEFYEKIDAGALVSTSQPSPASVTELWDRVLESYESLVYLPMSSGLSGSCASARMLAEDYGGRVEVVDNKRISVTLRRACMDALAMSEAGYDAAQIARKLEDTALDASIYIMVDTLTYLRRGGRITPAVAAIGTLLKIKPLLQIQGEKLDSFAKVRTSAQGMKTMIQAVKDDIEKRFGGTDAHEVHIDLAYSYPGAMMDSFREEVLKEFPWAAEGMFTDPLSLSVGCHIGPGSMAIALSTKTRL